MSKSVILLSGGLDSCTVLAMAMNGPFPPVYALSVFYGQRHDRELKSAASIAEHYGVHHRILDFSSMSSIIAIATALVNKDEKLAEKRSIDEMSKSIPRSYVPGRNTLMLGAAQSVAEAIGAKRIFVGFNAVDYSGYPDCRPNFVSNWNNLAHYATKAGVEGNPILVDAPIISLSKVDIVRRGLALNAPYQLSWSCYSGGVLPCGRCDSCIIRYSAFREVGVLDPVGAYEEFPL